MHGDVSPRKAPREDRADSIPTWTSHRPLRAIHSTLCTRVLLNLRQSAAGSPGLTSLGTEQANAPTLAWELASIAFPENDDQCPIDD